MKEPSKYEPILIKISEEVKKLDLEFKTYSGLKKIEIPNPYESEEYQLYKKAKNLKPFQEFIQPYPMFYQLTKDVHLGYGKGKDFYNTSYQEQVAKIRGKFGGLLNYENVSGVKSYHDQEFFEIFFGKTKNKEMKALFVNQTLVVSSIENFIIFREKLSHLAYNDEVAFLELKNFVTEQYKVTPEELRVKFFELYPKVEYSEIEWDICQIEKFLSFSTSIKKFDFVDISNDIFLYSTKNLTSYKSQQSIFNIIIYSLANLKEGGYLRVGVYEIDHQIVLDLIGLLTYFFDSTYLMKGTLEYPIGPRKKIVCTGFKGILEKDLKKMIQFSKKWLQLHPDCGINLKSKSITTVSGILKSSYKINTSIKDFFELESLRKIRTFNSIINGYNLVLEKGLEGEKILLTRQVRNTIGWLEYHGIESKLKYKRIDKTLLKEDVEVDFKSGILKTGDTGEINKSEFLMALNIYRFTKRLLTTLDKEKLESVKLKLKKFGSRFLKAGESPEIKEVEKVFGDNEVVKFDSDTIRFVESNQIKENLVVVYKPFSSEFKDVVFVRFIKGDGNEKNFYSIIKEIFVKATRELERLIFYYENSVILKMNETYLNDIKLRNKNYWDKYFN